jgi:peptidoglycan hydrolase-like protein with peptidoglycan-binding domain
LDGDGKVTTKDSEKLIRLQAGVGDKPLVVAKNTLGDVNGDGRLDASDVDLLLAIASGRVSPAPIQKQVGDLNSDGKINVADAQLLFASMSSLISKQQTGAALAGDINGDGLVNADDFELLKKVINKIIQPSSVQIAAADLNKDGTLSQEDLEAFRREFLIGGITPGASPSATPSAYVYVRLGSSHPDIKIIKSVLNREGLYNGPIDELFDRDLQDALLKFQKKYNLPATGKLNFATVKKLNELNSASGVLPKIENKIPSLLERIRNLFSLTITRLRGR